MPLDIGVVLTNLIGLFLMMGVGYAAARAKWVPEGGPEWLSAFLLKVALPCTIFSALATRENDPAFLRDCLITLGIGAAFFPVAILLFRRVLSPLLHVPEGKRGIWSFSGLFSNFGFMGYPVVMALMGPDAVVFAVILGIDINLCMYTAGAMMIASDGRRAGEKKLPIRKAILQPANAATALALLVFLTGVRLPQAILMPVTHLGNVTTPMSMVMAGMVMARSRFSTLFGDKHAYSAAALRLLAVPLVVLAVLRLLPIANPLIVPTIVVVMSMPTASAATILAQSSGCNVEFAAKTTLITSILSILTIPVICMLL